MSNDDTYAVLEFQGYVVNTPIYDRDIKSLWFRAQSKPGSPLQFRANGETAKAYKNLLRRGRFVRVTATPSFRNYEDCVIVEWEAKRICMLGTAKATKRATGNLSDKRVIDGLMPQDDEIPEVGYVDPELVKRFISKEEKRGNDK